MVASPLAQSPPRESPDQRGSAPVVTAEVRDLGGAPDEGDAVDAGPGLGIRDPLPQLERPLELGPSLLEARVSMRELAPICPSMKTTASRPSAEKARCSTWMALKVWPPIW